ncbi:cell division topological specificity factor MinE [Desulforudis sp. 1088]|uniref:cell division topological specificity factor MinE n=1 Tax=unclassified Candidatus Desulforudis TaxID=2635950 RepID=UPI003471516B
MLEFLARIFGRDSGSKSVAKERLRLVLVHDRANVSPQLLQLMKADLIKVISNYLEIDDEGLEVSLERNENQVALVANIPVKRVKRTLKSTVTG